MDRTKRKRGIRLYLIGCGMGLADLIPGISGGTVAFLAGIYTDLLLSIESLQLFAWRRVAWSFLLPLGVGILTSLFLFAQLVNFLLLSYRRPLYALFFGMVVASTWLCMRQFRLYRPLPLLLLLIGASLSWLLTEWVQSSSFFLQVPGLVCAGCLGSGAMLLPGISGSMVLQLLGVYTLFMQALATPHAPGSFAVLASVGVGIAFGLCLFSRSIRVLLSWFPQGMLALLVGCMVGGLRVLWISGEEVGVIGGQSMYIGLGFLTVWLIDLIAKRGKSVRNLS